MAYLAKKNLENALESFRQAVASDYDSEGRSIAHNNMAMIFLRQGNLDKAENHFRTAIGEREQYATPYYGLGLIGLKKVNTSPDLESGKYIMERAVNDFKQAVMLNPNYVKAFWGLASAYAVFGNIEKKMGRGVQAEEKYRLAIEAYEQITAIDPRFASQHPDKVRLIDKLRSTLGSRDK
jgi:tetratricopeptide (TPR) repeat protein